jgi:phage terminase large subunit
MATVAKIAERAEKIRQRKESRNEIYNLVARFKGRYIILIGGSGSGKSYEIADRLLDRMENEPKSRILGVRAQRNQVSESQFPLLKSRSKQDYRNSFGKKESRGDEEINHINGAQTIFSGLDDVEKLKSIFDITSVWVEEADQVQEKDINELDRRLRGYKDGQMQIYMTFNPVSVLSYLKKRFFDKRVGEYKIMDSEGNESVTRLNRTIALCGKTQFEDFIPYTEFNIPDEELNKKILVWSDEEGKYTEEYYYNTLIVHSTYRDNKFIDSNYSKVMLDLKENDPDEYNVYSLGLWGIAGGTYFDKSQINLRIQQVPKPVKTGYFEYKIDFDKELQHKFIEEYTWVDDPQGYIHIYKMPKAGYPYVLSGDSAGDGSDWNTGILTDNTNGVEVACVRINFDEDLFALQMLCLGMMYNNALIGIEINNTGTRPMKIICEDFAYSNCYYREQSPDSISGQMVKKIGWLTTKATRPFILSELKTLVRDTIYKISSLETLNEMTTFVKNEKGKAEAASGMHDDMIMAWAINLGIKGQQTTLIFQQEYDIDWAKVPEDYIEDYERANDHWKQIILETWRKQGLFKRRG